MWEWLYKVFTDPAIKRAGAIVEAERAHEVRMKEMEIRLQGLAAEDERRLLEIQTSHELAKKAAHEQTLELVEAVLQRVQVISVSNQEAMGEIAKGVQENAKALNSWMDLFKQNQGPGETHTLRAEDEYEAEMKREEAKLRAMGYLQDPTPDSPDLTAVANTVGQMFSGADRG